MVRIEDLPPPPSGRSGWPWTGQASAMAEAQVPDDESWPTISVVTPSYNQGDFLEETIRSVLLQGYPKLEYVVVDGESTDASVDIIRKYSPWLSRWRSEGDRGQAHAINWGFSHTRGSVMCWLNSDDTYRPGTLLAAARTFLADPGCDWVSGALSYVDASGEHLRTVSAFLPAEAEGYRLFENGSRYAYCIHQPATFWSRRMWEQCGPLDERLHYSMDRKLWLSAYAEGFSPHRVDQVLACFRQYASSKSETSKARFAFEGASIHLELARNPGFNVLPNLMLAQRLALRGVKCQLKGR